MKILIDENIDVRFKGLFADTQHDVFTIRDMNWTGVKNGKLLQLLKENDFDCWLVVDKNLPYQQNIQTLPCIIIVLDVFRNTLKHISPLLHKILFQLENPGTERVIIISEDKR